MIQAALLLSLFIPVIVQPQAGESDPGANAAPPSEVSADDPAPIADAEQPHGVLRFEISDRAGRPMPGRLTFEREAGVIPDLFPNTRVRPTELAVRRNVVYTLSGRGAITVPVGKYSVYATRGIEWSLAAGQVTITEGEESEFIALLSREVSTLGWISGDFHLHTLTFSGHGDADLNERIITLIGEGVEFAVATDHNHNTDYEPTVTALGVGDQVVTVVGNEVSTPIGHLNAFPLEPDREVPDPQARDANALFKMIRGEPNRYGIVPVIQLNHPRWGGIDFFTQTELDPITGTSSAKSYSADFDTIEIFNSNPGWGYFDADLPGEREIGAGIHSVLQDWYNLLNRGYRYVAVGNSDSHNVHHNFAGYPRNFVQVPVDSARHVEPAQVADALRAGRCYTTLGPLVEFTVDGKPLGSTVQAPKGRVLVEVKVQTPVWIYVHRVKIVVNGNVMKTIELDPMVRTDSRLRWPSVREIVALSHDSWIVALVESDESLAPIVNGADRPILPMAVTNPIRVNIGDDQHWSSPWEWARAESKDRVTLGNLQPSDAALVVLASAEQGHPQTIKTVLAGLAWKNRHVVLSSLRAVELLASPVFTPSVNSIWSRAEDPFLALTAARALAACDPENAPRRLGELLERFGRETVQRYPVELDRLLPTPPVRDWKVIGYFPNPTPSPLFGADLAPLADEDAAGTHPGKAGPVSWTAAVADESGYLDLGAIAPDARDSSISFAQTWLLCPDEREVIYALGTDDGCRLWVGGEEIYRDETRHGASPLQQIGKMKLTQGWNRVLVGVENGGGPTGLYFRVMDPAVEAAAERP